MNSLVRCNCQFLLRISNLRSYQRIEKSKISYHKSYATKNEIGVVGWMLLVPPITAFALGTWQVKRKIWKENLIANIMKKTTSEPISLIENLDNLEELEYQPIYAKGHFLHNKELHMGPRSLLNTDLQSGGLISQRGSSTQGYLVITPFQLSNEDKIILVNRGWVPTKHKNPKSRKEGQIEDEVSIVGIVRTQENRPTFMPRNNVESNQWFYRDIEAMAKVTGSDQIFVDSTNDFDVPGGPVGGQTRVNIRNEHLSYVLTWYGLSASTGLLWYLRFVKNIAFK